MEAASAEAAELLEDAITHLRRHSGRLMVQPGGEVITSAAAP